MGEISHHLFVQFGGNVVCVDESLASVEPLSNLAELSGQGGVQEPLPVPDLGLDLLPLGLEAGRRLLVVFALEALRYSEVVA